jgi:hypothetical protein
MATYLVTHEVGDVEHPDEAAEAMKHDGVRPETLLVLTEG